MALSLLKNITPRDPKECCVSSIQIIAIITFNSFFSSLGRRWLRTLFLWRYIAAYFPVKLVKTAEIDPTKNVIFCTFPHGVLSIGAQISFGTNALNCDKVFPGFDFRLVSLDQSFWCPFLREYVYTMGKNTDLKKKSFLRSLDFVCFNRYR